jgi:putative proteasome-type protease
MTYCIGIQVEAGLVFASDTRTSASFDDVRVHAKTHVFEFPGERCFLLMSAGNLGTTQAVIARLQRDLTDGAHTSLRTPRHMFEVAEYIGQALVAAQAQVSGNAQQSGVSVESTLILGGQIRGEEPAVYLIYPLGNCIAASPETPYLQIGESKYGKPILDRIIHHDTTLEDAARCALVSLDSTIRSNVSVGLPIDLTIVREGELRIGERMRLDVDTPLYAEVRDNWARKLEAAVRTLPRFPWEQSDNVPVAPPAQAQRPVMPRDDAAASQAAQQQQ